MLEVNFADLGAARTGEMSSAESGAEPMSPAAPNLTVASAVSDGLMIRFVPDRIETRATGQFLRGAVVLLPAPGDGISYDAWPQLLTKIAGGKMSLCVADPATVNSTWDGSGGVRCDLKVRANTKAPDKIVQLWQAILRNDLTGLPKREHDFLKAGGGERVLNELKTGLQNVRAAPAAFGMATYDPRSAARLAPAPPLVQPQSATPPPPPVPAASPGIVEPTTNVSADAAAEAEPAAIALDPILSPHMSAAPATGVAQGPIRISSTGTSALATSLHMMHASQLAHSLARASGGTIVAFDSKVQPHPLRLATDLFSAGMARAAQLAMAKKTLSQVTTPEDEDIAKLIVRRGTEHARGLADDSDEAANANKHSDPFSREPVAPRPEDRPSPALLRAIADVREADRQAARAFASGSAATPEPADPALRVQRALVSHMMAMRTPPAFKHSRLAAGPLPPDVLASIIHRWEQAATQRVAGLLSFPSLARALHLVIDVEVDVTNLPLGVRPESGVDKRFYASVAIGDDAPSFLWTACQIVDGQLCIVSAEDGKSEGGRRKGIIDFGAKLPDTSARFSVATLDVIARAEHLLSEAKAEADRQRSANSESKAGSEGNARSIGVTILDAGRAWALQKASKRSDEQKDAYFSKRAVIVYAEDLGTGLRLDVGVYPQRDATRAIEWRSLMLREMTFQPLAQKGQEDIAIEPLIDAAMSAADDDPVGFRKRIEEAAYSPAASIMRMEEVTAGDKAKSEDYLAEQTIGQWEGPPLGAPCGIRHAEPIDADNIQLTEDDQPTNVQVMNGDLLGLPLRVKLSLAVAGKDRPAPFEFGRQMWFNARDCFLGGVGLSTADAVILYRSPEGATMSYPARSEKFKIERHERLGAPLVACLAQEPADRPGDALDQMVVRSAEYSDWTTDVTRRVIYVPGVPQALAAMHPHPHQPAGTRPKFARALDLLPPIKQPAALSDEPDGPDAGIVPVGGMANILIDPETGGLQVRDHHGDIVPGSSIRIKDRNKRDHMQAPPQGVFKVEHTGWSELEERHVHYYPDPAADGLMLQLVTKESAPAPIRSVVEFPVYDENFLQAVPSTWSSRGAVPCSYPFAIPILLEVCRTVRATMPQIRSDSMIGTLDSSGKFRPLAQGKRPPRGSVTMRRVTIDLPPGTEATLKSWCATSVEAADFMAAFNSVAPQSPDLCVAGVSLTKGSRRERAKFTQLLRKTSVPEHAEILSVGLTHAVQRPATPAFAGSAQISTLRRDVAEERWSETLGPQPSTAGWEITSPTDQASTKHGNGATAAWIGGSILIDRQVASNITLGFQIRDVQDVPGRKFELDSANGNQPVFRWSPLETLNTALPRVAADRIVPANPLETVDLLSDGAKPRALNLRGLTSRAYHVKVVPNSTSRFTQFFTTNKDHSERFESVGQEHGFWVLATRRPDPMGKVEMLPAFVWTTSGNGCQRRTVVRLTWRRPKLSAAASNAIGETAGCWYSSGEQEMLGIVLAQSGTDARTLGPAGRYISNWGGDPIRANVRASQRPDWRFGASNFTRSSGLAAVPSQWLPLPADDKDLGAGPDDRFLKVDLLCKEPNYDPAQDAWWTDIEIAPGAVATPFINLSLVRYQPHAKFDARVGALDMHVSQPRRVGFALEPTRRVTVVAEPKDKENDVWPVRIIVQGPYGIVRGGTEADVGVPDPALCELLLRQSRPHFSATVIRDRYFLEGGGEEIMATVTSKDSLPPTNDVLWETVIYLRERPTGDDHYVFIEERDLMLSAHQTDEGPKLVASGPRFMAKIRVRKQQ